MEKTSGILNQEIDFILKNACFSEGYTLSGSNEVIGKLSNYERAIYTRLMMLQDHMESSVDKFEKGILISQISTLSGYLWFFIRDRLNLWNTGNQYAINRGISVVVLEEKNKISLDIDIEIKNFGDFDSLSNTIKNDIIRTIISSETFKKTMNSQN